LRRRHLRQEPFGCLPEAGGEGEDEPPPSPSPKSRGSSSCSSAPTPDSRGRAASARAPPPPPAPPRPPTATRADRPPPPTSAHAAPGDQLRPHVHRTQRPPPAAARGEHRHLKRVPFPPGHPPHQHRPAPLRDIHLFGFVVGGLENVILGQAHTYSMVAFTAAT